MKKLFFLITFFCLSVSNLFASFNIEYGFIGSNSFTFFNGKYKNIENIKSLPNQSFGIGTVFNFNINERYAFQFEPLLLNKGGQNSEEGIEKHALILTYIELPVIFKFKIKKPYFQIGGYHSFLLSAKHAYKTRIDRTGIINNKTEQLTNNFKSNDNGIILGAGIDLRLSDTSKYFTVEIQYLMGLTNILDYKDMGNDSLKNSAFTFKIGMML